MTRHYKEARFVRDVNSFSILVVCPFCRGIVCREEDVFETDEIGECEDCRRTVYIPWESYYDKVN